VEAESMFIVGNDFVEAKTAIRFADGTDPSFFIAANRNPK
jgi:hypothetical protein